MARRMLSPIVSVKHYVHTPAVTIATGVRTMVTIVNAIAKGSAITSAADVEEGAVIKAIYLEYWVSGETASQTGNALVLKRPSGATQPTYAEMQNLGAYINKKNILSTHQGLMPTGGNVMPIFREWIKIPKGKQRMGLGDLIQVAVSATGTTVNLCGFATFKSYL